MCRSRCIFNALEGQPAANTVVVNHKCITQRHCEYAHTLYKYILQLLIFCSYRVCFIKVIKWQNRYLRDLLCMNKYCEPQFCWKQGQSTFQCFLSREIRNHAITCFLVTHKSNPTHVSTSVSRSSNCIDDDIVKRNILLSFLFFEKKKRSYGVKFSLEFWLISKKNNGDFAVLQIRKMLSVVKRKWRMRLMLFT